MLDFPTSPSTSRPPRRVEATLERVRFITSRLREADRREIFAQRWTDDTDDLAYDAAVNYPGLKFVYETHEPVAAFGAVPLYPGVWSAWMFATDSFPTVGLSLTKFIRRAMIPSLMRLGAHRCDARSIDGHHEAHAWLKALGAVEEGRMLRYGKNGEDFLVFRWDRSDVLAIRP